MPILLRRRQLLAGTASVAGSLLCPSRRRQLVFAAPDAEAVIEATELARFRERLKGRLILPDAGEYESARRVASFNPATDKRPQMVVRCAAPADVVRAVIFAREHTLEVAVRGGGHDILGASVCQGGMVIDLSSMKAIALKPQERIVRVEGGLRSGELNAATQPAGLAAVLGCNPAVGVAGLTLGGGLGWFLGRYGAACDSLVGAELVTAEGKELHASASENPDLFWSLRGGGGNFGIVTRLEYSLYPVARVLAGVVAHRGRIGPLLRFYRDFIRSAPDDLTVEVSIFGKEPTTWFFAFWSGAAKEGVRVLRPLRSFGSPTADTIGLVSYASLMERLPRSSVNKVAAKDASTNRAEAPKDRPGYNHWKGGSLRGLSDEAVDQIAEAAARAPEGGTIGLGHYMHGQVCRVSEDLSPLVRRPGELTYFFSASWGDRRSADSAMDWVNRSSSSMDRFSSAATYINYLSQPGDSAVRASYGKSYERLAALKRKYDPNNFFHLNRNILPARG